MTVQEDFQALAALLNERILGQPALIDRLLIALLADGHLLVEGAPGLAKTQAVKELARYVEADFHRIQFTPDLLPADLTGSDVFRPETSTFEFQRGPLFHHLLLADEINRAPAKVQAALLEAMAERQISIGQNTWPLDELFLVMATQNPIEQEGTYPLPEAQLDRFLMQVFVDYPDARTERDILALARRRERGGSGTASLHLSRASVLAARQGVTDVFLSPAVEEYLIELILATRGLSRYGEQHRRHLRYGASPRGTIALDRCARAHAWLAGRDYVTPEDIRTLAPDVLRHRLLLTFEAEADGLHPDRIVQDLLQEIPVSV